MAAGALNMTNKSFVDVEMMVMLPLGVLAAKLQRIEADLRLLGIKTSSIATAPGNECSSQRIEAQLELIEDVLDSIKELVSNLKAVNPVAADLRIASAEGQSRSPKTPLSADDEYSSHDGNPSDDANRKPYPELDD
jgi:hypothetical protein